MKKIVSLLLALCLCLALCAPALATEADYTVAEKLLKQLEYGSGFEGTLTLSAEGEGALVTAKPLTFDVTCIHVLPSATAQVEQRYTLTLRDGDQALSGAELSLRGGQAYLRADLLGDAWYAPDGGEGTDAIADGAGSLLQSSALPGLIGFALSAMSTLPSADAELDKVMEEYRTKLDLWIEGYRQSAVLGKLEDGTTTMEVNYDIPPAAIKAQLKQMVLDALDDDALLEKLRAALPEAEADRLLDPMQQNYYFYAIDELPIAQSLTIARKVSLKGDTLSLSILLPLTDSKAGEATLRYDRTAGEGDLPEENVIRLESGNASVRLAYRQYRTMADLTVFQGTLLREPRGASAYAVGADTPAKALSATFSVSCQETSGRNDEGKDQLAYDISLSVDPEYTPDDADDEPAEPTDAQREQYVAFPSMEGTLKLAFASNQAKAASTSVTLALALEAAGRTFHVDFDGKTKRLWTPTAFDPSAATAWGTLSEDEQSALLAKAALQGGLLIAPYLAAGSGADAPTEDAAATPEGGATPAPSEDAAATPEGGATPEPTDDAADDAASTPSDDASASPEPTETPAPSDDTAATTAP